MHWSEASITWRREDHPPLMPRPKGYALVLDPVVFSETHCRGNLETIAMGMA
jgi:hypothetical protein